MFTAINKKIGIFVATAILASACTTLPTKQTDEPKLAIQKGIQPLISSSYSFQTEATIKYSLEVAQEPEGKEEFQKRFPNGLYFHSLFEQFENSKVIISGSFDPNASKIGGKALVNIKSPSSDLKVKTNYLLDIANHNLVFDLKDMNEVIIPNEVKATHPDYQEKLTRIILPNADKDPQKELQALFNRLDEKNFSYISLDKVDRKINGSTKIRVKNMDKVQLDKLLSDSPSLDESADEDVDLTEIDVQNTRHPKTVFLDFTLDRLGNIIRIQLVANNIQMDRDNVYSNDYSELLARKYTYANFSVDTVFSQFGKESISFNPDEAEIITISDFKDYDKEKQVSRVYGESSAVKTAIEAALFEGKHPVVNESEVGGASNNEWVGWSGSKYASDLQIKNIKRKQGTTWYIVTTLGKQAEPDLHGTKFVLKRQPSGEWGCEYYTNGKKELESFTPYSCTVKHKAFVMQKK